MGRKRGPEESPDREVSRPRLGTFHESPLRPDQESPELLRAPQARRSLSANDIVALDDPEQLPSELYDLPFLELLLKLWTGVDDAVAAVIQSVTVGTSRGLDTAITRWLDAQFPPGDRRPMGAGRAARRPPLPPPPVTAYQRRMANFKKAQDLF